MIAPSDDSRPPAPHTQQATRDVLGLDVRDLGRFALAGITATVLFAVLLTGVGLVSYATLPGCTGDSCMGGAQLWTAVLAVPAVVYVALAIALAVLRTRWPLLVALVATLVVLLGLGTGLYLAFYQDWGLVLPVILIAIAIGIGPLATVTAGSALRGRGPSRFVLITVVPLLAVAGVGVPQLLLTPLRDQSRITAVVPQPYKFTGSGWVLSSLDLNPNTWTLDLAYDGPGHQWVSIHETRPPSVDARKGRCAPRVALIEAPTQTCTAVPVTAPDLAMWRTAPTNPLSQVVVVRADALIQLSTAAVTTDGQARAWVNRLAPATAKELIGASRSSDVPDPGPPPPAS